MINIDLESLNYQKLSIINQSGAKKLSVEGKGWSFSYVYHFSEIKDIYLILRDTKYSTPSEIYHNIDKIGLQYSQTPWSIRRVLEVINSLRNFGLINDKNQLIQKVFIDSKVNDPINKNDLNTFKNIYFSFFRFKEIHSWFTNPFAQNRIKAIKQIMNIDQMDNTNVLYPFSRNSRFTDTFLLELKNNSKAFFIEKSDRKSSEDLMRFWDVYVKWGRELGLVEKFNINDIILNTPNSNKSISCIYFISEARENFNLYDFIKKKYRTKYIFIPELIYNIAMNYRYSILDIKKIIVEQYENNKNSISLERTSRVLINKKKTERLYPQYKGSYVSHLKIK